MLFRLLVVTVLASAASALAVGWWLRNRRLVVCVLAAVAGGLATACTLSALIVGLFVGALFEPWPLALRQGPDTTFSRSCYAEFLRGAPPIDVSRVYCRKEWGFGGESISSIRFAFRGTSTVDAIVNRLRLEAVPASERDRVRYLGGPRWWPQKDQLSRVRDVYQRRGIEFFWVDSEAMEAYYQHAHF
jgi:hypothetical protein